MSEHLTTEIQRRYTLRQGPGTSNNASTNDDAHRCDVNQDPTANGDAADILESTTAVFELETLDSRKTPNCAVLHRTYAQRPDARKDILRKSENSCNAPCPHKMLQHAHRL